MDIFLCLLFAVLKDATIDSMHIFLRVSHVLGPLHMSPVDRAGSVFEISPRHSFLFFSFLRFVHIKRRVGPGTEILVAELEIFPI